MPRNIALSCYDPRAFPLVGGLVLLAVRNNNDFIPMFPLTQGMMTSDASAADCSAAPDTGVSQRAAPGVRPPGRVRGRHLSGDVR